MMVLIENTKDGDAILNIDESMIEIFKENNDETYDLCYKLNLGGKDNTLYFEFEKERERNIEFEKIKKILINKEEL